MIETKPEDFQGLGCEPERFRDSLISAIVECEFLMKQSRRLENVHRQLDEAHAILVDVLQGKEWDE